MKQSFSLPEEKIILGKLITVLRIAVEREGRRTKKDIISV